MLIDLRRKHPLTYVVCAAAKLQYCAQRGHRVRYIHLRIHGKTYERELTLSRNICYEPIPRLFNSNTDNDIRNESEALSPSYRGVENRVVCYMQGMQQPVLPLSHAPNTRPKTADSGVLNSQYPQE